MSRRHAVGLPGGAQPLLQVGIVLDGMHHRCRRHRCAHAVAAVGAARGELGAPHTPPDLGPVVVAVRGVDAGQHDRSELLRRRHEVGAVELQRVPRRGDRRQPQPALAVRGGDHRHRPVVLALRGVDHGARPQLQHRQLDRVVGLARVARGGERLPVLLDVAERARRLRRQLAEPFALALQPAFQAHDVAVGLELRERQRQQLAGGGRVIGAHEVGGHVERRPERRAQVERLARRQLGHLVERDERAPQHDRRAVVVDAAPPGAAGQLGVLAGRQRLVPVAGELGELLDHHAARRHVDPHRERLGGEHDLDQPLDEARLDDLLERRHHPGVVRGEAGHQLIHEAVVAEHREIGGRQPLQPGGGDLVDARALLVDR